MQIKPTKPFLYGAIVFVALAIFALMAFSIDRSAWAFGLWESGRPHQEIRSNAAAIVVELAIIAFIIAKSITVAEIRRLATIGLIGGLVITTLPNLWGGWVYGWQTARATMPDSDAAFLVAGASWLIMNASIPGGIYLLSEIEALLVRVLLGVVSAERTAAPVAVDGVPETAPPVPAMRAPAPVEVAPVVRVVAEPHREIVPAPHKTGALPIDRTKAEVWMRIIDQVTAPEPAPQAAIGANLGISESMVRKHLRTMMEAGVLVRDGKSYRKNGVALEVV